MPANFQNSVQICEIILFLANFFSERSSTALKKIPQYGMGTSSRKFHNTTWVLHQENSTVSMYDNLEIQSEQQP
jgi:hypothetical protein